MSGVLAGYDRFEVSHEGLTHHVFRRGTGPGVIIIHEVPGITPRVAAFANRVADRGFTAVMPSLFGVDGKDASLPYSLGSITRACVSREFHCLVLDRPSPVTRWLSHLARLTHQEAGGPGVGAVGMCFTGGFALAMMLDSPVEAPVLSQPSTPFPFGAKRKAALGLSDEDVARLARRAEDGCPVLGLRFSNDPVAPHERFDTLRRVLGDRFLSVEIDSSPGNPDDIPRSAHSVLTEHLVDEPGHPTREALETVLGFFEERLLS